jgi:hypothetical protein
MLMKTALITAILVIFALPVLAVTYEWEDSQGTINFTEDPGSIPKQYRKKAKILGAEEEIASPETGDVKDKPKSKVETPDQAAGANKEIKKVYGGKTADAWSRDFAQINGNIKSEEEQLSELKGRIKDTSKMSRGEYLSIQMGINGCESRLQRLRGKLAALTEEANRVDLPAELRGR